MADAKSARPAVKVRFYRNRNRLKDKAAGLGAGDEEIEIDEAALVRAEQALLQAAEEYPDWVLSTVMQLATLHQECVEQPSARARNLEVIQRIAHDMKGQGGTFGYPLITRFATTLHKFATQRARIDENHLSVIKSHIDAMRAVLRDRISGDGGDIGAALAAGLDDVIQRMARQA